MSASKLLGSALVGAALFVSATSAHAVSYDISNDQAGWLGSVQAIGPTTFGTGNFVGVGCAPGVACAGVAVNGLPGVGLAQNGNGSASFDGGLLNNLNGGYLEWTFATAQNGWGGTFAMAAGNSGLKFVANDTNLGWIDVTSIGAGQTLNGFLGFSSTDQFLGVRVFAGGEGGSSYRMTDVSIASAVPASVPEPGSLALLSLSLAGLGLARRRKA